jgi:hypothetical protein
VTRSLELLRRQLVTADDSDRNEAFALLDEEKEGMLEGYALLPFINKNQIMRP